MKSVRITTGIRPPTPVRCSANTSCQGAPERNTAQHCIQRQIGSRAPPVSWRGTRFADEVVPLQYLSLTKGKGARSALCTSTGQCTYTQIHTVLNDSGCPIGMSTVRVIHIYSATPGLNRAAQRNASNTKRTWMHDCARR
jgi:hypothetical protein